MYVLKPIHALYHIRPFLYTILHTVSVCTEVKTASVKRQGIAFLVYMVYDIWDYKIKAAANSRRMEKRMIGLIITGHGQFASGLVSALELLIGHQELLAAVDFESGQSWDTLMEHLKDAVGTMQTCHELLILCDMIGGSPYKCAAALTDADPRLTVLYGINLGMTLELAIRCRMGLDTDAPALAGEMVATGKAQIGSYRSEPKKVTGKSDKKCDKKEQEDNFR